MVIYGFSLGMAWICQGFPECDSYVGAHGKNFKPKGSLANKELREIRILAHKYFDCLWSNQKSRRKAYKWLSLALDIPEPQAHIGMFDVATCKRAIEKIIERVEVDERISLDFRSDRPCGRD
jgi:hypothetical protein